MTAEINWSAWKGTDDHAIIHAVRKWISLKIIPWKKNWFIVDPSNTLYWADVGPTIIWLDLSICKLTQLLRFLDSCSVIQNNLFEDFFNSWEEKNNRRD